MPDTQLPEEVKRFREVFCQPQEWDDIILWRKDVDNCSSTELIQKIEKYWIDRMSQAIQSAEAKGEQRAWEKYKQFMSASGVLIYDGAGNLVKFDETLLTIAPKEDKS